MPDCDNPKCHEHMTTELASKVSWKRFNDLRDCAAKKMPKSWLWIGFLVIGLPLLVTGARVWSQQESDSLRYAEKQDVVDCQKKQLKLDEAVKHMNNDINEIKNSQYEAQKDIKEILRYLRDGER